MSVALGKILEDMLRKVEWQARVFAFTAFCAPFVA